MKPIFEYNDTLNNPYEAFLFNSQTNPFPITPHWHYFIEIIYLLNGDACVQSGTQTFILQPGDLLIFHPQVIHSISFHTTPALRSEEHTSELQSRFDLVCRLLLEKK